MTGQNNRLAEYFREQDQAQRCVAPASKKQESPSVLLEAASEIPLSLWITLGVAAGVLVIALLKHR